jgi:dTDP-glucose 4,6-dehydratase
MILVTGGAGFIGSNFIRTYLGDAGKGAQIVNLDLLTYAGNMENLAEFGPACGHLFARGDIGDRALVDELLKTYRPAAVVNFAAESHVDRSIRAAGTFIETNILGLFNLLEACREYWLNLPERGEGATRASFRFVQVSTDEVYGSLAENDPGFAETSRHQPNSPYSASKAAGDHLARAWHHTYGLPVITTNCSNNFGPYQFPEKLIPLAIVRALTGQPIPIYGDGRQIRDWLFVEDHCRAIMRVLEAGRPGEVYNIGARCEKRNIEVVQALCDMLDQLSPHPSGRSYREQINFVTDRPGHDRRYAIDSGKIEGELGWRPQETFETGLARTVRWYLDHPAWVENVHSGAYRNWLSSQRGDAA